MYNTTNYNSLDDLNPDLDGPFGPPQDTIAWQCHCGCYGMYITPIAIHCWNCHKEHKF